MQNLHRIVSRISSPFTTRSSIPWRNCSTISSGNPYIDTANEHESWENFGSSSDPDFDSVFSFPTELTGKRFNEEDLCRPSVCEMVSLKQVRGDTYRGSILSRSTGLAKEQQFNGKKTSGNPSRTSSKLSSSSLNEGGEFGMVEEVFDDALKDEMYKLRKENPEVYTIKKLATDYGIMVQRVSAILFLKEIEEEEEEEMKKLGRSLDDYVEMLLDVFPEFFDPLSNKEFNASSLPNECDLTVMHEGWDELLEILKKCAMKYQSRRMKCCVKN